MYSLPAFQEHDLTTLHDAIERYSFGQLVSQVDGQLFATHLPFLLDRTTGSRGTLIGHTARANPQCFAAGNQTVLAIFSGPHAYVSPTWYQSDNVVPTWNYIAVHVYGNLQIVEDKADLMQIVTKTTSFYEQSMPSPWRFDGTTTFIDRLVDQIIGFRIEIDRIEGKWKLNQNHPLERQQRVVAALEQRPDDNSHGVAVAMRQRQQKASEQM